MADATLKQGKKSLKILHLIDSNEPGGAETVFIQLAELMQQRGHQSFIVVSGEGWVSDELARKNLPAFNFECKGSFNLKFLKQLINLIRTEKIDIIQSHLLGSNVYAAMAGFLTRTPVVATYHGMIDVSPNERFKNIKRWVMKLGISRYVVVSHNLLKAIEQQNLLDASKTQVVYNGINLSRFTKAISPTLKKELHLKPSAKLIGCLGNLHHAKGYDILIQAAIAIIERHKQCHFLIAGHTKEPLLSELKAQAVNLGIADHIHFLGFRSDTVEFLKQLDLFVLPSRSEGFSIATLEAMAASLPVLATRCGGPEEILTHLKNGFMVDAENAESLTQGIETLLSDTALAKQLAAEGEAHVRNTFSIETMLNDYEAIYNAQLK